MSLIRMGTCVRSDYGHYDINIKVPVYTLREDLSYRLNMRPDDISSQDTSAALETGSSSPLLLPTVLRTAGSPI